MGFDAGLVVVVQVWDRMPPYFFYYDLKLRLSSLSLRYERSLGTFLSKMPGADSTAWWCECFFSLSLCSSESSWTVILEVMMLTLVWL